MPGDLKPLASFKGLRTLRLSRTNLDDEGLAEVATLRGLQQLDLAGTRVTAFGLKDLDRLADVQRLDLNELPGVDDRDLLRWSELPKLRELQTDSPRVTYRGVLQFREARPEVQLVRPCSSPPLPFGAGWTGRERFDADAAAAFRAGDYAALQKILERCAAENPDCWEHQVWLGHTAQLAGRWQEAVDAYLRAHEGLAAQLIANPRAFPERLVGTQSLSGEAYRDQLVLLAGQLQRVELQDPQAAIETLQRALHPLTELTRLRAWLTGDAAELVAKSNSPISPRPGKQADRRGKLLYPLLACQQLALASEEVGEPLEALDCWNRLRLCGLMHRLTFSELDPRRMAKIWHGLPAAAERPPMPAFLVFEEEDAALKFDPRGGRARLACWDRDAWTGFALLAPPGHVITRLEGECEVPRWDVATHRSLLWSADPPSAPNAESRRCASEDLGVARWNNVLQVRGFRAEIEPAIPLVFLDVPQGTLSVQVRATLRPKAAEGTEIGGSRNRPQNVRDLNSVLQPDCPFQPPPGVSRTGIAAPDDPASLIRLDDGRLLCASGSKRISLTASGDGVSWDPPWEYEHNSIFVTGGPSLIREPGGRLWMLYASTRPRIDRDGSNYLWLSHSADGRAWSTPVPVTTPQRLTGRLPVWASPAARGGWLVLHRGDWGWGPDLLDLKPLADRFPLRVFDPPTSGRRAAGSPGPGASGEVPTGSSLGPPPFRWDSEYPPFQVHACFDASERCHVVYRRLYPHSRNVREERGYRDRHARVIQHAWSDDLSTWTVHRELVPHREGDDPSWPQLIIDGQRVALLYWIGNRWMLKRGAMVDGQPQLEPPIVLNEGDLQVECPRVVRDGDRLLLPLPGQPLQLLQADVGAIVGNGD